MTYDSKGDLPEGEHRSVFGAIHEWKLYDRAPRGAPPDLRSAAGLPAGAAYVPEPGVMHVVADPVYPKGHPRTPTAGELEHLADELDSLVPDTAPRPGA